MKSLAVFVEIPTADRSEVGGEELYGDPGAVELGDDEPVEILFGVVVALVGENAQC